MTSRSRPPSRLGYAGLSREADVGRLSGDAFSDDSAQVAEEVPVAMVYNAEAFTVMMASPADLEDLAIGFSLTESIVHDTGGIERLEIVRHSRGIEVQMQVGEAVAARLAARRRGLNVRTGCGVCGVESIDEVLRPVVPITSDQPIGAAALWAAASALESRQPLNAETRAVHAAAFCRADGTVVHAREDVGRHNALDKVIGALARSGATASDGFLVVTSRASYELVQKAALIGAPLLAAVSRPTGLAIDLARESGITLVGLLRGRTANIYTHRDRVRAS